jgi:hypothetical protein
MSGDVRAKQDHEIGVAPRQGILILGMHRSGTSAVARVINLLGARSPAHLMPATPSNPRGHWESDSIFTIHEEMLKAAGTAWDDWRRVDPNWFASSQADIYRQQLKRAVITEYGEDRLLYIKDPRICRFVPFWVGILDELNITPSVIFSVRNPLEVAYSLERRDSFSLEKSLLLWLRHTLDAENATRRLPRFFVDFEQLLTDWQACMLSAGTKLGISWPKYSDVTKAQIEEFLDYELRHHHLTAHELHSNPDLIELVIDIYESIVRYSSDADDLKLQATFNIVRERFEEGCNTFGAVLRTEERTLQDLNSQLSEAKAKNDQLERELESMRTDLEIANSVAEKLKILEMENGLLKDELQQAKAENEKLGWELKSTRTKLEIANSMAEKLRTVETENGLLKDELQQAKAENEKLKVLNEYLDVDIDRVKQVLSRYEAILERNRVESVEIANRTQELLARRSELERQNAALVASTSWRVTRPLRWIRTQFAGSVGGNKH